MVPDMIGIGVLSKLYPIVDVTTFELLLAEDSIRTKLRMAE